jgi:hypothetical protein
MVIGGAAPIDESLMRAILLVAVMFAALPMFSVGTRADGAWCRSANATNCGYHSFEQCQAARSGSGGFCQRNPFSLGAAGSAYGYETQPRKRHRRDY